MSGKIYILSNKKGIITSSDKENSSVPEENGYISEHSKNRIEGEQKQTEIPPKDMESIRERDSEDVDSSKTPRILPLCRKKPGIHSSITERDIKKTSQVVIDSNTLHESDFDQCPEEARLPSYPLNADPEVIDVAENHDRIISSTYISDEDLEAAGPSSVTCDVCYKNFQDKHLLEQHKEIHSSENSYSKEESDHAILATQLLKNPKLHTMEKKRHRMFPKTFSRKRDLHSHKNTHTGEKFYECEKCCKKFAFKHNLLSHLRIHTGEKLYECENCHKKFIEKRGLRDHLRLHSGEKPFECEICRKRFTWKNSLKIHLLSHTSEKLYECEMCHKKFKQKPELRDHLRLHSGEKPYECEICHKRFTRNRNLDTHLRIHSGVKPYKCGKCRNIFSHDSSLKRHEKHCGCSSADRDAQHICNICQKKFTRKDNLKVHYRTHTEEKPYECEKCDKKFHRKCGLDSHNRIHNDRHRFQCRTCGKRFTDANKFSKHSKKCGSSSEK